MKTNKSTASKSTELTDATKSKVSTLNYGQENEASIIGLVDNWTVCLYL